MDVLTPEQRRLNMSQIRGKNTKPELYVRSLLWARGFRYQLHRRDLPGTPDIVFPRKKKVVFVHGCFWHKHDCKYFKWPETNVDFWQEKILTTVRRDEQALSALASLGWQCLIVWECEAKGAGIKQLEMKLLEFLSEGTQNREEPSR